MTEKNKFANRQEVIAVPCPAPTASWHPISHGQLIQALDAGVKDLGIGVQQESYTLAREGRRLFGSWVLDIGNGSRWMLGFRQGIDKSLAIGITAGTYVTVCSNMCFGGDFIEFRMHTSGLTMEALAILVKRGLDSLRTKMHDLFVWQESLKTRLLSSYQYKALTYDLLSSKVITPSGFERYEMDVRAELLLLTGSARTAVREIKDIPLYAVHGGVTRHLREMSLEQQMPRSARMNKLVEQYQIMARPA